MSVKQCYNYSVLNCGCSSFFDQVTTTTDDRISDNLALHIMHILRVAIYESNTL